MSHSIPPEVSDPLGRRHVVIVGPMGVGKSTVGVALAAELDWPFSDSDTEIEAMLGVTGRDFAERSGVAALHHLEASVVIAALLRPDRHVVAAAASVVEHETVRWLLSSRALVVRLTASPAVLVERGSRGGHRRLLSESEILELAERRDRFYRRVADITLDVEIGVDHVVEAVRLSIETIA